MNPKNYGTHIVILGASPKRDRFSNAAVRVYTEAGFNVAPVHPDGESVEGIYTYDSLDEIDSTDILDIYVKPEISEELKLDKFIEKAGVKLVILNPDTASDALKKTLAKTNVEVVETCSIRLLGKNPEDYLEEPKTIIPS